MAVIYYYQGDFKKDREASDQRILAAYSVYRREQAPALPEVPGPVLRTAAGKPYLAGVPLHFSLADTGNCWIIGFAEGNMGLDAERRHPAPYQKLFRRYFAATEPETPDSEEAFYRLWVKREAWAKFTGEGLLASGRSARLEEQQDAWYQPLDLTDRLGPDMEAGVWLTEPEPIVIRRLEWEL